METGKITIQNISVNIYYIDFQINSSYSMTFYPKWPGTCKNKKALGKY